MFLTALRALPRKERQAVLTRNAGDDELREEPLIEFGKALGLKIVEEA